MAERKRFEMRKMNVLDFQWMTARNGLLPCHYLRMHDSASLNCVAMKTAAGVPLVPWGLGASRPPRTRTMARHVSASSPRFRMCKLESLPCAIDANPMMSTNINQDVLA